jgi:hypothetical protein
MVTREKAKNLPKNQLQEIITELKLLKKQTLSGPDCAKKDLTLSELNKDLRTYQRELRARKNDGDGVVKKPKDIFDQEILTKEQIIEMVVIKVGTLSGTEVIDVEAVEASNIAEQHKNLLLSRECSILTDTVLQYLKMGKALIDGGTSPRIIIRDSWKNFCSLGSVKDSYDKHNLKEAIEENRFSQVDFIATYGKREFVKYTTWYARFNIIKRVDPRPDHEFLLPRTEKPPIDLFEIEVNPLLFLPAVRTCGRGYYQVPEMLNDKISRALKWWNTQAELWGSGQVRPTPEKYRPMVQYIIRKWLIGAEKRKTPMKITYGELSEKGYLPATKNRPRRVKELKILTHILKYLNSDTPEFTPAGGIYPKFDHENEQIIFQL